MANPTDSSDQGDPLASFESEPGGRRDAAPVDFDGRASSPPPPLGSVSFNQVRSIKGFGFVEGVALVQAACEAVTASGRNAGVPDLHGLFLTSAGEVVFHGAPTSDPPARELARVLHQLVSPELLPPAGRLFVGRWINNDHGDLKEFSAELAYFARPNRQEILVGLHGQCSNIVVPQTMVNVHRPERAREPVQEMRQREAPQNMLMLMQKWARDHKPEVTAAIAVIASVIVAGLGTWFWQASTVAAANAPGVTKQAKDTETVAGSEDKGTDVLTLSAAGTTAVRTKSPAKRANAPAPASASRSRTTPEPTANRVSPAPPSGETADPPSQATTIVGPTSESPAAAPPQLPSAAIPDMKIYTVADTSVEPPILRSSDILEVLIKGFQTRENVIELVISEKGDVQQVRMIEAPQRIPDVMLLSRAKELHFDPAMRNGVPVRYRLRLSWKVTP